MLRASHVCHDLYNTEACNFMVFSGTHKILPSITHGASMNNNNDLDKYGCMESYNGGVIYHNKLLNNSSASEQDAGYVHRVAVAFQYPNARGLEYGTRACCRYVG